eukprot:5783310-Prymnesium_polylepis.1
MSVSMPLPPPTASARPGHDDARSERPRVAADRAQLAGGAQARRGQEVVRGATGSREAGERRAAPSPQPETGARPEAAATAGAPPSPQPGAAAMLRCGSGSSSSSVACDPT